jgi:hypothetical protein
MSIEDKVKLVALYFPQFHRIPENDKWWGQGFTDWTNVKKAQPQFPGHYQPRIPKDGRYYDQSQLETIRWQVELAKSHGLYGFCHYHYWFDGKQLLETPTNLMLANRDIDFPFCLAWANETWSRRWDGREEDILLAQTYRPEPAEWEKHFDYLYRAWSDPRAIRIDGKPVFMIYRPHLVIKLAEMLTYWQQRAKEKGLPGLFFVAMKQYEYPQPELLKLFDGSMHFQPFEAMASPDFRPLPQPEEPKAPESNAAPTAQYPAPTVTAPGLLKTQWRKLPIKFRFALHQVKGGVTRTIMVVPKRMFGLLSASLRARVEARRAKLAPALVIWDYDSMWNQMIKVERDHGLTTFPGAFVDWDNTARYGRRARLFKGASPERFRYWFSRLVNVTATRPVNERFIFLNAWNEWAEGTYLEPDERHDTQHLEIVRDVLRAQNETH